MPSAAVVEDGKTRLTIGSNVEHGMKEIPRGVEIMIDRILNQDDGKGLGSTADAIPTDMLPVDMQFSVLFEKKTQVLCTLSTNFIMFRKMRQPTTLPIPLVVISLCRTFSILLSSLSARRSRLPSRLTVFLLCRVTINC